MTDPYGALAMLCFALTHTHTLYAILVVPLLAA